MLILTSWFFKTPKYLSSTPQVMRWSLILSTFITVLSTLSFVGVALVIPWSSDELVRRADTTARMPSKIIREAAVHHKYMYFGTNFFESGKVERVKVELESDSLVKQIKPGMQADHIFEIQMLEGNIRRNFNGQFKDLPIELQEVVKTVINSKENMVLIPGNINGGKGQVIRHALAGKSITPKETRDTYILCSYPDAANIADKLDKAFKEFKDPKWHLEEGKTFHNLLRDTMEHAKILEPGEPSPQGSPESSSSLSLEADPSTSRPGSPPKSPSQASLSAEAKKGSAHEAAKSTNKGGSK